MPVKRRGSLFSWFNRIDYAWTLARAIKGYVWLQSAIRDRGSHFLLRRALHRL